MVLSLLAIRQIDLMGSVNLGLTAKHLWANGADGDVLQEKTFPGSIAWYVFSPPVSAFHRGTLQM